jgi:1-acyl-sn-glycerol-3-phosphate acyltransferase
VAKDTAPVPLDTPAVRLLHAVNRIGVRMYHHLDVLTPCRFPARGRAIMICNHTSGLDPHLIQSCSHRVIIWMMAREYYDKPVIKPLLDKIGVIPIARNGRDSAGTRAALRALENEQILGIFPEGRIETTREFLPFQTGVALMAIKTRSPVYPVYLDGTQRGKEMAQAFARRQRATIAFGPEVQFDRTDTSREGLDAATEAMRAAIAKLRDDAPNLRRQRGL